MLLVDLAERFRSRLHALRASQQKITARVQSVVKGGQHLLLQRDAQIDEEIAATDEIYSRERRIPRDVLNRKDTNIAHLLADLIAVIGLREKLLQALRRNIRGNVLRILAVARHLNGFLADVGRENLNGHSRDGFQGLQQQYGDRVRLFASGAAGNPDTNRQIGLALVQNIRDDVALEILESFRVPEEGRHIDQQVAIQRLHFRVIGFQALQVGSRGLQFVQNHAALDAPAERTGFVLREVNSGGALYTTEDASQLRFVRQRFRFFLGMRAAHVRMAGDARQFFGDLGRRKHKVRRAELSAGAARHVRVFRALLVLRERDAPFGFDGCQPQRTVGAGTRKNYTDGLAFSPLRQGAEESVDHHTMTMLLLISS